MTARKSFLLLIAGLMFACPATASHASLASTIKLQIQQVYDQADAAASRKDANAAVAHYGDPTMQQQTHKGLSDLLASTQSALFSSKIVSIDVSKADPSSATVIVKQHFQGLLRKHGNGSMALAGYDAKIREYWVKNGTSWVVMRSRTLVFQRLMNSKPVSSW